MLDLRDAPPFTAPDDGPEPPTYPDFTPHTPEELARKTARFEELMVWWRGQKGVAA